MTLGAGHGAVAVGLDLLDVHAPQIAQGYPEVIEQNGFRSPRAQHPALEAKGWRNTRRRLPIILAPKPREPLSRGRARKARLRALVVDMSDRGPRVGRAGFASGTEAVSSRLYARPPRSWQAAQT